MKKKRTKEEKTKMAEIVETVREIQFKEKCSSKNRYSRTTLCKRDRIIGQSGERELILEN